MATTRFRFTADALAALGISADTPPDEMTTRLGFPAGAKVTSAKADGDGAVLNVSGATFADGSEASGEVTGAFTVGNRGGVTFDGFRSVDGDAEEPAPPAQTATTQGA